MAKPKLKTPIQTAAYELTPDETKPVKRGPPDLAGLRLGDYVYVRLGEGRRLPSPDSGWYDPAQIYYLLIDTTLLRRLRGGDWVLVGQNEPG